MALPQYQPKPQKDPITEEKERLESVVKDIPLRIGVHAGKGGVGKTTIATQLALQLSQQGKRVGLVDADVDCPNVPELFGLNDDMMVEPDGKLRPVTFKDVKIVSTGFMEKEEALIIRGPIKHRLLTDFIEKTNWGKLDALVFDFPPGTSDVPLSAMQVANLTGIIIVTTPDRSSLADARRAVKMAQKLNCKIYGIIENMSGDIFGQGGGKKLAEEFDLPFLLTIKLSKEFREKSEAGEVAMPLSFLEELA